MQAPVLSLLCTTLSALYCYRPRTFFALYSVPRGQKGPSPINASDQLSQVTFLCGTEPHLTTVVLAGCCIKLLQLISMH